MIIADETDLGFIILSPFGYETSVDQLVFQRVADQVGIGLHLHLF